MSRTSPCTWYVVAASSLRQATVSNLLRRPLGRCRHRVLPVPHILPWMHQWTLLRLQTPFQPLEIYPHSTEILNNPTTNDRQDTKEDERPFEFIFFSSTTVANVLMFSRGPSFRRPISSSRSFTLEAFKPPKQSASSKGGKRRASARPFELVVDDMSVEGSETAHLTTSSCPMARRATNLARGRRGTLSARLFCLMTNMTMRFSPRPNSVRAKRLLWER